MGREDASDEELMLAYRDGNADAFEVLYGRHRGPLFRYCLRHCRDRGVAEETFQDVWMRVIGARERYEPRAKFTTWLYRIAHNRVIDRYRSDDSGRLDSLDAESSAEPEANPRTRPDDEAIAEHRAKRLRRLLGTLPAEQRDAFLLHEEAGLSLEAIAEVSGVGRETVKSRLRYAVAKLRGALEDER